MKLGYTRVSTREQNADSQIARLEQAGCERIFVDVGYSSRVEDRPDWIECRKIQRPGDELVIPSLDRVAGTDSIAISVIRDHAARGVKLRSLDEPWMDIDPSTAMGEAMLKIMATLAQLRVDMIRENTRRGVEHALHQVVRARQARLGLQALGNLPFQALADVPQLGRPVRALALPSAVSPFRRSEGATTLRDVAHDRVGVLGGADLQVDHGRLDIDGGP